VLKKPKVIVLDSWAVMAYLEDQPAGERIADTIANAHDSGTPLLMTVINLGEVWYVVARRTSQVEAENSVKELRGLGIKIVDADWGLTRLAAYFKSKHKMSYADCFAAALAKERKAHLLTGDPEFHEVEKEIRIIWANQ
jgi:ribonuclease VapC